MELQHALDKAFQVHPTVIRIQIYSLCQDLQVLWIWIRLPHFPSCSSHSGQLLVPQNLSLFPPHNLCACSSLYLRSLILNLDTTAYLSSPITQIRCQHLKKGFLRTQAVPHPFVTPKAVTFLVFSLFASHIDHFIKFLFT